MRIATKITVFLLVIIMTTAGLAGRSLAASNVIYVSPGSSSVQKGDTVGISLRINPATSVNGVQVTLGYNASLLQYLSIDTSSSAFPVSLQQSVSSGSITLQRGILSGGTSTDSLIAKINFKALAGSGSTTLSLSNANATSGGSYTNPSIANGTVSFTSPPSQPTPPPPQNNTTNTSTGGSSSSSGGSTSPVVKESSPKISSKPLPNLEFSYKTTDVQFDHATIKVSSNIPVQAYVKYGEGSQHLNQKTSPGKAGTTSTIKLGSKPLTPGTKYYYKVFAADSSGKTTAGPLKSFTTKGYTLQVTVLDGNNNPLQDTMVTLHSNPVTATTDSHGVATFENVAPGVHHLEYQAGSQKFSQLVYVINSFAAKGDQQTAVPQSSAVILAGYKQPVESTNSWQTLALIIVILVAIAIAIAGFVLRHKIARPINRLRFLSWHATNHVSADKQASSSDSDQPTKPDDDNPPNNLPPTDPQE